MEPLPIRPDLEALEPYVSPQAAARYRLNTNESPYPPPQGLMKDVARGLHATEFNRYPDRDATKLLDALAEHNDRPRESIWIANGSNEVFLHIYLAFGGVGRTSLTFEPTYSLHTLIPQITATNIVHAPRSADWSITPGAASAAIDEHSPDIAVLCSPNNPTGALEPAEVLDLLLERVPLVIVDEAYIEFAAPGSSLSDRLNEHRNLVITKTFSKAWSLAGVRLGYLLGHPDVVSEMARVRLPYHLSAIAQLMGVAALRHRSGADEAIETIKRSRATIEEGIAALGLHVYPSQANFVLFETGDPAAPDPQRTDSLWVALRDREVLVRNYSSNPALRGCLRVTAGTPEETEAFLAALKEVV